MCVGRHPAKTISTANGHERRAAAAAPGSYLSGGSFEFDRNPNILTNHAPNRRRMARPRRAAKVSRLARPPAMTNFRVVGVPGHGSGSAYFFNWRAGCEVMLSGGAGPPAGGVGQTDFAEISRVSRPVRHSAAPPRGCFCLLRRRRHYQERLARNLNGSPLDGFLLRDD